MHLPSDMTAPATVSEHKPVHERRVVPPAHARGRYGSCALAVAFLWMVVQAHPSLADGIALKMLQSDKIVAKAHNLREPSGLALAVDGTHLWTVSDNTSEVFLIDLDGDLKPTHTIEADLSDPEGITLDMPRHRLIAVNEETMDIVVVDLTDGTSTTIALETIEGFQSVADFFQASDTGDGLEGITSIPETGAVFLIKEKKPRLMIELTADLARITGALVLTADMGFADKDVDDADLDVSGLSYDAGRGAFWITSDTGKRMFLFDPVTRMAKSWTLKTGSKGKRLPNAEGVALSQNGDILFVVTDDKSKSRLIRFAVIEK